MKSKKKEVYSYQDVCEILCEACRLKIPMNTHTFNDGSYRIVHIVNGETLSCDASEWRKLSTPKSGETVNIIIKKVVQ